MTGKLGVRRHEPFGGLKSVAGMGLPLTLTQKDLILWLPNYSKKAAMAYLGALCAYYGSDYPDTVLYKKGQTGPCVRPCRADTHGVGLSPVGWATTPNDGSGVETV